MFSCILFEFSLVYRRISNEAHPNLTNRDFRNTGIDAVLIPIRITSFMQKNGRKVKRYP